MSNALDELQSVMFTWKDRQSVIKTILDCSGVGSGIRWWRLQLAEESDDDLVWKTTKLEDCVRWTDEKLKDWPNCKRMAWNIWDFKHRQDAEKFITLFHLSWVK